MTTPRWEHFEHEADIGIRGYADNVSQAFEQAALALSGVITDLDNIENIACLEISCEAPDYELLFIDWLNEIIFQMATRGMLFSSYQVSIEQFQLTARLCGESANQKKHQPAVEIKGATFTELKVAQADDGLWMAQCVVDV